MKKSKEQNLGLKKENKNPNRPKERGIFNVVNTRNQVTNSHYPANASGGVFTTNKNMQQHYDFMFCSYCMQPIAEQKVRGYCPHCNRKICLECG